MKLSDQPEYLIAIPALTAGDYASARAKLHILLSRAESEGDLLTHSYLLQVLGDVEAKDGNLDEAYALHNQALGVHCDNPLACLLFAKSLHESFKRDDLSLGTVETLRALLASQEWRPGPDEPNKEWYEREIDDLVHKIRGRDKSS